MGDEGLIDNGLHTQFVGAPAVWPAARSILTALALAATVAVVIVARLRSLGRGA
jgi:hypothetical protein